MEKAIFITKISQLKYITAGYDRLYYGNEFCERLIPGPKHLRNILCYLKKRKLKFSLVTPYVTDKGLKKVELLLELLKSEKINCEIIINDFGVLNLINQKYLNLTPVLGRLLTKQKRGPRLIKLLKRNVRLHFVKTQGNPKIKYCIIQKKLPPGVDPYYKGSNAGSVPVIHDFLISQRVRRIELDNTAHGLFLKLPKENISASLYLPYVYISTTFFCPTAGCNEKKKSLLKIKSCNKECQSFIFKLRHKTIPRVIFLKGNTQFYKNTKVSLRQLKNAGVSRLVFQPEIPI